jgi:hypothetical protein
LLHERDHLDGVLAVSGLKGPGIFQSLTGGCDRANPRGAFEVEAARTSGMKEYVID